MNDTSLRRARVRAATTAFALVRLVSVSGILVMGCSTWTAEEEPVVVALPIETNSIGMKMALVPAGEFMMGSSDGDADEKPPHRVRITKPFYLGQYVVTMGQFRKFRQEIGYGGQGIPQGPAFSRQPGQPRPSDQTDECPEVQANWDDAVAFCDWLSKKEGKQYRLPTEAEWEYACRAGTKTRFSFGNKANSLGDYAWFIGNSGSQTHPVGQKKPNPWGFYDMHGNVFEWCADCYDPNYYAVAPAEDPPGPSSGAERVTRGGSWRYNESFARSAARSWKERRSAAGNDVGFRAARDP